MTATNLTRQRKQRQARRLAAGPRYPAPIAWTQQHITYSQSEQRDRRRKHLPIRYGGLFKLDAEVSAIVGPLALELSTLPRPTALRGEVFAVADAVREVLSAAVDLIAADKRLSGAVRDRTARAVADMARQADGPQIGDDMLTSGAWAPLLTSYVAPFADDLAAFLAVALPPDHGLLNGEPSASERVERSLRGLDRAAAELSRVIPKARARQSLPTVEQYNAAQKAQRDSDRAAAALTRTGLLTSGAM